MSINVHKIMEDVKANAKNRYQLDISESAKPMLALDLLEYDYDDFLFFSDEDFVRYAYLCILKREPEEEGKNSYLKMLYEKQANRIQILYWIRNSPEGKLYKVNIRNLSILYKIERLKSVAYVGKWLSAISEFIFTFSKLIDSQKKINSLHQRQMELEIEFYKLKSLELTNHSKLENLITLLKRQNPSDSNVSKVSNVDISKLYIELENRFRGSSGEIRTRLLKYLSFFKKEAQGIDLGCGRGEWLSILRENNIFCKGVEQNAHNISFLKTQNFNVVEQNAIDFLKEQPSNSLDFITGFHIIEHLETVDAITLISESFRVIKPKGFLLLETPNPENILSASFYFYLDPTHKNPIPSLLLEFLFKYFRFQRVQIIRADTTLNYQTQDIRLNSFFNSPLDYGIIGYKNSNAEEFL